jgi:PEP-CTERM motif
MNTKALSILLFATAASASQAISFTVGLPGSNPKTAFNFGTHNYTATASGANYDVTLNPDNPSLSNGVGEFKWNFYVQASTPTQYLTSIDFAVTVETSGVGTSWKNSAIAYYVGSGEYEGSKQTASVYSTIAGPGLVTLHQTLDLSSFRYNKWHIFLDDFFRTTDGAVIKGVGATVTESTPVPEPMSLAVLGVGALGLLRRRRRNA